MSMACAFSAPLIALDDYFTILGISPIADPQAIEAAYQAKKTALMPDPLTVNPEDVAEELISLEQAYTTLIKPGERRYYMYLLLNNAASGRAPSVFAENVRFAQALANRMLEAAKTIGSKVSLIDTNESIDKAYERQKKLLNKFRKGAELEQELIKLDGAKTLLTQPWRILDYAPAGFEDDVQRYMTEYK